VSLLETLATKVGVRMAGSPEAERAAEAVADALRDLGLGPSFQEFHLLGYDPEEPELEIGGERWEAGPCMYAHPTDGVIEGRVRHIGEASLGEFFPPAHVFAVEDKSGRELARLQASPFGGPAIPFVAGPRQIAVGPTAFISGSDAVRLRRLEGAIARVRVGGCFMPGRRDRNVVARLRGESDEAVVVSAHFDSVWHGPGAIDNATGIEALLRVARRLADRRHPRSVLFCAFAAEEIGLLGARHFVYEAGISGELERIRGVVNLDCVGRGRRLELLGRPAELRTRAEELARDLGLAERYRVHVEYTKAGLDSVPFTEEGVPALSIVHFPYPEYHLPSERLELVDERRLADSVDLAVALVESQLERPVRKA
jgi:aminopeptidase YwaD